MMFILNIEHFDLHTFIISEKGFIKIAKQ